MAAERIPLNFICSKPSCGVLFGSVLTNTLRVLVELYALWHTGSVGFVTTSNYAVSSRDVDSFRCAGEDRQRQRQTQIPTG
jgi:hypothetical protein